MKYLIALTFAFLLTVSAQAAEYIGSWKIDDFVTFDVTIHTPATGSEVDPDSAPTYRVYEDETTTPIVTGTMAKLDDSNTVGFYSERFQATAASGFEKGKRYTILVHGIVDTVGGNTTKNFQIEAEVDANIVSDKTGYALTQTFPTNFSSLGINASGHISRVTLVDTLTTYTSNTPQTGDSFARIGVAGAGLTNIDLPNQTMDITGSITGNLSGSIGSVGTGGITAASIATDAIGAAEIAADAGTELGTANWATTTRLLTAGTNIVLAKGTGVTGFNDLSAAQVNTEADTALADYDGPTNAEMIARTLASGDYSTAANLATLAGYVDTEVNDIKTKTDFLPSFAPGFAGGLASHNNTDQIDQDLNTLSGDVLDVYNRLGVPVGASISADIAALPTAVEVRDSLLNWSITDTGVGTLGRYFTWDNATLDSLGVWEAAAFANQPASDVDLDPADIQEIVDGVTEGFTISPTYVDQTHTWRFTRSDELTSQIFVYETIEFDALVAMDFTKAIPSTTTVASVVAVSVTLADGSPVTDEIVLGTPTLTANKMIVNIPVEVAEVGEYIVSVKITTVDSQTYTRRGPLVIQ